MFIFMHRQMLARYNAERVALGLPLVESFDRYLFRNFSKYCNHPLLPDCFKAFQQGCGSGF
jgi:hypothetical protein